MKDSSCDVSNAKKYSRCDSQKSRLLKKIISLLQERGQWQEIGKISTQTVMERRIPGDWDSSKSCLYGMEVQSNWFGKKKASFLQNSLNFTKFWLSKGMNYWPFCFCISLSVSFIVKYSSTMSTNVSYLSCFACMPQGEFQTNNLFEPLSIFIILQVCQAYTCKFYDRFLCCKCCHKVR